MLQSHCFHPMIEYTQQMHISGIFHSTRSYSKIISFVLCHGQALVAAAAAGKAESVSLLLAAGATTRQLHGSLQKCWNLVCNRCLWLLLGWRCCTFGV